MQKVVKTGLVLSIAMIFGVGSAFAGDQIRKRAPKRDRSCQSSITEELTLAATQNRNRKQIRKGSCQNSIVEQDQGLILAAARDRVKSKDRLRSC